MIRPSAVFAIGPLTSILTAAVIGLVFSAWQRRQTLRAAHAELEVIYDNAPIALLLVDHNFRLEKFTAVAAKLTGRCQAELVGRGPGEAIGCLNSLSHPRGCGHGPSCPQCPLRTATLDSLLHGRRHENVEAWLPAFDGNGSRSQCLLFSTAAIQFDRTRKVLISAMDITLRKNSEMELQRAAQLIELSHDAIIETDAGREIRRWNNGAEEIYGWSASEAVGRNLPVLLRSEESVSREIAGILALEGRWEGELDQVRRDGHRVITESRQLLVRDGAAVTGGILEIDRDITARRKTQQDLADAHRRTTIVLESISDGFNFLDREWRYAYVNQSGARLVHKTPEELLGKTLWEVWPHAAGSAFETAYRRAVAENVLVRVEAFYPEPLNAWFDVRCYPSSEGLSLFFSDTTERKRTEERLQETVHALESALAEKTVLLKEVHHRVKNNLAVIASLLNMRALASEDSAVREALQDSQQRVYSIALIHEHLYAHDHLDRIDFAQYARELVERLHASFVNARERVSLTFQSDTVDLAIHRAVPCALILNELLSNVFKHAFPAGRTGRISVIFREAGPGAMELMVEDDGVGLAHGWQHSKSLGWQIIRILARQLDGSIAAEPSSGTRFVLRFPVNR